MRLWTQPEARAALQEVRRILAAARQAHHALAEAHAHLEDLRSVEAPHEGPEVTAWQARAGQARSQLEAALLEARALGVEVKDIVVGLVDFRAALGDGQVYLCWRDGEPDVAWWHPLDGGFGMRRPIPDFTPVA